MRHMKADICFWSPETGLVELPGVEYDLGYRETPVEGGYSPSEDGLEPKHDARDVVIGVRPVVSLRDDSPKEAQVAMLAFAFSRRGLGRIDGLLWRHEAGRVLDAVPVSLSETVSENAWPGPDGGDERVTRVEFRSLGRFLARR